MNLTLTQFQGTAEILGQKYLIKYEGSDLVVGSIPMEQALEILRRLGPPSELPHISDPSESKKSDGKSPPETSASPVMETALPGTSAVLEKPPTPMVVPEAQALPIQPVEVVSKVSTPEPKVPAYPTNGDSPVTSFTRMGEVVRYVMSKGAETEAQVIEACLALRGLTPILAVAGVEQKIRNSYARLTET